MDNISYGEFGLLHMILEPVIERCEMLVGVGLIIYDSGGF